MRFELPNQIYPRRGDLRSEVGELGIPHIQGADHRLSVTAPQRRRGGLEEGGPLTDRRRSPRSPRTSARSSGANIAVRRIPRMSRGRLHGAPLIAALFARPPAISRSTVNSRPSFSTVADTCAWSAPVRMSGASVL